jgi:hypothetical protein
MRTCEVRALRIRDHFSGDGKAQGKLAFLLKLPVEVFEDA